MLVFLANIRIDYWNLVLCVWQALYRLIHSLLQTNHESQGREHVISSIKKATIGHIALQNLRNAVHSLMQECSHHSHQKNKYFNTHVKKCLALMWSTIVISELYRVCAEFSVHLGTQLHIHFTFAKLAITAFHYICNEMRL